MEFFKKNATTFFFIFFLFLGFLALYQNPEKKKENVSLSTLVQAINRGEVSTIEVQNNDLTIKKNDGTEQTGQKEPDASLTDTLKN